MAYINDDIKANAQKFGPKKPNKFILFINQMKVKTVDGQKVVDENKPSLVGYSTDKDMNLSAVSLWKGKTKNGNVKFTGVNEDLGIKQNVVEMPTPKEQSKPDNLDDEIPF